MNPRILATLAATVGVLSITGCGQSQPPAVENSVQKPSASVAAAPLAPAPQTAVSNVTPAPVVAAAAQVPAPQSTAPALVAAHTSVTPMPAAMAPAAKPGQLNIRGFVSQIPSAWIPTQPSSTMRAAQFEIPPAKGADPGEVAVFYFPPGQGGSHEANIERWASQFAGIDGQPVAPQTSSSKSGATAITLVELNGTYARGIGMGPAGDARPDQTLIVAMVEAPIGRITLQMYGPRKTVSAQREGFLKLVKGFRPA